MIKPEPATPAPGKHPAERGRVQPVPAAVETKAEAKPVVPHQTKPVGHHGAEQPVKERKDLKQGGTNTVEKVHK